MDGGVSVRPSSNYGQPRFSGPPPGMGMRPQFRSPGGGPSGPRMGGSQPGGFHSYRQPMGGGPSVAYDGKRIRNKTVLRKTVDFNTACITYTENRLWQRDFRDAKALQTDELYIHDILPPPAMVNTPMNCVTSRFVRNSMNKFRCPIFCVCWTPEGRRLITGASSGEFTLWNGLTFNFETILQAHDTSVRCMTWSHNDQWMLTADHGGYVKYWQTNMNNVKMYQAHKEAIRGVRWAVTVATLKLWHRLVARARVSSLALVLFAVVLCTVAVDALLGSITGRLLQGIVGS